MFHVVLFSGQVLLRLDPFLLLPEPPSRKVRKSPACSELQQEPREGREERTHALELTPHTDTQRQDRALILRRVTRRYLRALFTRWLTCVVLLDLRRLFIARDPASSCGGESRAQQRCCQTGPAQLPCESAS